MFIFRVMVNTQRALQGRLMPRGGSCGLGARNSAGALCKGVTQCIPAGVLGALQAPPAGSGAFWQQYIKNWLKIRYLGRSLHP